MSELKPCPFCGAKNIGFETCHIEGSHWVECEDCHAMSTPNYSREEATIDWNNRPHENKIKAKVLREWADQAEPNNDSEYAMVNNAYDYADKLERGEL